MPEQDQQRIVCPKCKGDGKEEVYRDAPEDCPRCKGTGKIAYWEQQETISDRVLNDPKRISLDPRDEGVYISMSYYPPLPEVGARRTYKVEIVFGNGSVQSVSLSEQEAIQVMRELGELLAGEQASADVPKTGSGE